MSHELAVVRRMLEELRDSVRLTPKAVSIEGAAQLLDVSPEHVTGMVARGALLTVDCDGVERIPMSEIDRLVTPTGRSKPAEDGLLLTYPQAAKRLGVGLTKLKSMVRNGTLQTSNVDGRRKVPRSELERIALPASSQSTSRPVKTRRHPPVNQSRAALEAMLRSKK